MEKDSARSTVHLLGLGRQPQPILSAYPAAIQTGMARLPGGPYAYWEQPDKLLLFLG